MAYNVLLLYYHDHQIRLHDQAKGCCLERRLLEIYGQDFIDINV